MAFFSKIDSYVKQIAIYLNEGDYVKSYELSCDMVCQYPDDMITYFLLAKSAMRLEKYEETIHAGLKAFGLSPTREDMIASMLLVATAHFMLGQYEEGRKLLLPYEPDGNENVDKLLLIFDVAIGDENASAKHSRELLRLNRLVAVEIIRRFLKGR